MCPRRGRTGDRRSRINAHRTDRQSPRKSRPHRQCGAAVGASARAGLGGDASLEYRRGSLREARRNRRDHARIHGGARHSRRRRGGCASRRGAVRTGLHLGRARLSRSRDCKPVSPREREQGLHGGADLHPRARERRHARRGGVPISRSRSGGAARPICRPAPLHHHGRPASRSQGRLGPQGRPLRPLLQDARDRQQVRLA